ncbi:MAG: twin-arginine translocase subunit TatC [Thermodesulfobacteriota bacterium]
MIDEDRRASLIEHLEELRKRLIRCFIAIAIGTGLAYAYKERLFEILVHPLVMALDTSRDSMVFTGLPEAFFTYLKVSLIAGIIVSLPVIFYEFWMFVAPGLYRRERLVVLPIILISVVFFAVGASFAYFFVFPVGFKFFLGFASESIRPLPSMKEYLRFASIMLLAFGLSFELPIVLTGLAWMGVVDVTFLRKNRKYAILIIFIAAAVLTPSPDVISQLLLAGPLMVLYEMSIWGARIFGRKSGVPDETAERGEEKGEEEKEGKTGKEKKSRRNKKEKKTETVS